jgi:hypothetical protein
MQNGLYPADNNDDDDNFMSGAHPDIFLFVTDFLITVTFTFAGNYITIYVLLTSPMKCKKSYF